MPNTHILATGRDARGRKQYRYHARWRELQNQTKFYRMARFGRGIPGLRRRIDRDLARPGLPRDRVLAAVLHLMDETLMRVGNEQYARENRHYGLTTLRPEHVKIEDEATISFEFRAKSGKEQRVRLSDPQLAEVVSACHELGGQELFQYVDETGRHVHVGSSEVNSYLRAITGSGFTAKDFRTWGGSVTAAEALGRLGTPKSPTDAKRKINAALDSASARLNNTRAVCRTSYVHPHIPEAYENGELQSSFHRARSRDHFSRSESAVLLVVTPR